MKSVFGIFASSIVSQRSCLTAKWSIVLYSSSIIYLLSAKRSIILFASRVNLHATRYSLHALFSPVSQRSDLSAKKFLVVFFAVSALSSSSHAFSAVTTLSSSTSTDPSSIIIGPGTSATTTDTFTFQTDTGTDDITEIIIAVSSASSTSKIEITSADGSVVYGSSTNPTGTTTSITLNNATLTASTTLTQYNIRVTPKTQANVPIGNQGGLYPLVTFVQSWTGTNTQSGSDSANTSIIIDNLSLPNFGIGTNSTTFTTQATSSTGTSPQSVAIGDLNNDGKIDLAVTNYGSNSVSTFLNTSTSTFSLANKVDYTTGASPASVAIGDLNSDGKMDLAVTNYTVNSVSTFLNTSTSTFSLASKIDYTTGTSPRYVAIGDLNNDGKMDLAVTNYTVNSVSTFLNTSTSTFSLASKVDYTTGSGPHSVAIGDLNNDGKMDLAVTNYTVNSVSTFLNTSTSTFSLASKVDYTTGSGPQSVAIGDLNNDGKTDLAVANYASNSFSTFLNTSTSTFSLTSKIDSSTMYYPTSVAIGDLNNDGKMDLAVTNYGSNSVSTFLNTSTSTFSLASKVDYTTGSGSQSVAIGDLNNDGKTDLAVANYASNSFSILFNSSIQAIATAGNAQVAISYITPPDTEDTDAILVLRAMSIPDTLPTEGTTYTVGNTLGNATVIIATSTFATSTSYTYIDTGRTNGTSHYYQFFTKDAYGNYSLASTPSLYPVIPNITTTLSSSSSTDPSSLIIGPGTSATTTDTFTFQTDAGTDIITSVVVSLSSASSTALVEITSADGLTVYGSSTNPITSTTSISLSGLTANTSLTQYNIRITPKSQTDLPIGSNGKIHAVTTHIDSWTGTNTSKSGYDLSGTSIIIDNLSVPNFGVATTSTIFSAKVDKTTGTNPHFVAIGDLNSDGKMDLVVANYTSNTISVFLNTSTSTFSLANKVDYTTGTNPLSIAIGDLNNDGKMDIAVANGGSSFVSVFFNTSTSTFSLANKVEYTTITGSVSVAIGDINNDSRMDLVVANGSAVSILLNTTIGDNNSFATRVDYLAGLGAISVAIGDLNNDGKMDIVTANYTTDTISILLNTSGSTMSFEEKVEYATGNDPQSVAIGDLNNDGLMDIAVANITLTAGFAVHFNTSTSTFSLASKIQYSGSASRSVAISDLNNDGKMDLAVGPFTAVSSLATFLNTSTSTFSLSTKVDYTAVGQIRSVAIGDLNNDGKMDLVSANYTSPTVSIFLNSSVQATSTVNNSQVTLSYTTPPTSDFSSIIALYGTSTVTQVPVDGTTYSVGNTIGTSTVGCIDTNTATSTASSCVVTGLTNGTSYHFKLFIKDIYGNYSLAVTPSGSPAIPTSTTTISSSTSTDPSSLIIGPGTSATTTNTFTFTTATGTDVISSIVVALSSASSTSLVEITSADGLTVYGSSTNPTGSSTTITLNNSTLTASTTLTQYNIRVTPKSQTDLSVGNQGGLYPLVAYIQSWTGTNVTKVGSDSANTSVIIDNLSVPNFGISTASTTFATKVDKTTGSIPQSVAIGDLNNDGKMDIAVANYSSASISTFLNTSTSTFSLANKVDYTTGSNPYAVTIGDLNSDGKMDLAVTNYTVNSVSVFLNTSTSTFSLAPKVDYTTGTVPSSVAIGDLNSDGKMDLAVSNYSSASVSTFLNTSTSTFSLANKVDYTAGANPYSVAIGDLNNDGKKDLAVANQTSNTVSTFLNTSTTTFSLANKVDYTTGTSPRSVVIDDLNNDGKNDLAVSNYSSASISTFLNTSTSTFSLANKVDYTTGASPWFVVIGDLNNDGKMDLAVANYASTSISTFLNTSTSTFSLAFKVDYTTGTNPQSVAIGDLNNDGKMDLAIANYGSNSVSTFLNTSTSTLTVASSGINVIVSYRTPPTPDVSQILILSSLSAVTDVPVDGTDYSLGNTVGSSTVACIDTTVATSTEDSCSTNTLAPNNTYYFKAFIKDIYGNYSLGVSPSGIPLTLTAIPTADRIVLSDGTDTATSTIAPGDGATIVDSFSLQAGPFTGSATISNITVQLNQFPKATGGEVWSGYPSSDDANMWYSVAYGNGLFVAVGEGVSNVVMTSPDGITWTARTSSNESNQWMSVTYGNGLFVAVSQSGTDRVMTSPDGITWTARTSGNEANAWQSVTYGNGLFVAVAWTGTNRVMTSSNGTTWTATTSANETNTWWSVTYGNGLFVAVAESGTNRVMTSPDGTTWTARTSAGETNGWFSVTYGNGLFVAVAVSGTSRVMTSPDGITWTARTSANETNEWISVSYGNGTFTTVARFGTNRLMTSPNGITWTIRTPSSDSNSWSSIAYGNGTFVAVADTGTNLVQTSSVSPNFATSTLSNAYQGVSLIEITNDDGSVVYGSASNPTSNVVQVPITSTLTVSSATSSYKIRITPKPHSTMPSPSDGADYTIGARVLSFVKSSGIQEGEDYTNTFTIDNKVNEVTVPTSLISTKWETATTTTGLIRSITYGNGLFVAVSDTGTSRVITSPDGITWTPRTSSNDTNGWRSVTYGNGLFVAVAEYGTNLVMTSSDGINWIGRTSSDELNTWYSVTYGNGLFVAVAPSGTNTVMTSPDGITWTGRAQASGTNGWDSVTYGNGLFVAVTQSLNNLVQTSPDGINWTAHKSADENNTWSSVTYGNGRYVAVALGGTNRIMTSTDGAVWTSSITFNGSTEGVSPVTFGGGRFFITKYATSTNTTIAYTSVDGLTWTSLGTVDTDAIANTLGSDTTTFYGNGALIVSDGSSPILRTYFALEAVPSSNQVSLNLRTPSDSDTTSLLVLQNTSAITDVPTEGTLSYATGTLIGTSRIVCSYEVTADTNYTCNATEGVYNGTSYYYKVFTRDSRGNYSTGVPITPATVTPGRTTTITTGTTTPSLTLLPGATATTSDTFTLKTDIGIDTISNVTVTLATSSSQGIALLEITSDDGLTVYGSSTNPTSDVLDIAISGLTVTDIETQYRIRITPKTHANMPAVPGAVYAISSYISSFTSTNLHVGKDDSSAVLTIDNLSPASARQMGVDWNPSISSNEANQWYSVTYGNGLFVAVAHSGTGRVMTSLDGITWTGRTSSNESNGWYSVTYGNGLFVAVANSGTGRVMTSPDGITWTGRTSSNESNSWVSVTYGNGLFVAVSESGTNRVMTSLDGITWTGRTSSNENNYWYSVTYSNGLFVAVAYFGTNRVMTSPDGITWTGRTSSNETNEWNSVTYGNGLFVAVAQNGTNLAMTSPDGITWTGRTSSNESNGWHSVTYGNGLFVATALSGTSPVMTSPDGITWTARTPSSDANSLLSITYGNGTFVAVASDGTSRVMSSSNPTASSSNSQIAITFTTPADSDITSSLVLIATSTISFTPTEGSTYATSTTLGNATALCSYTVSASTTYTCTATGLTNGNLYYFTIFSRDSSGNWGEGVEVFGNPISPGTNTVTLTSGSTTPSITLAPGATATTSDAFTFQTDSGTDSISSVTVTLPTGTAQALSLIEITNSAGNTVYGSTSTPSTDTPTITLTGLTANTTKTEYRIRVTPKTHANMPTVPGSVYNVTTHISNWVGTNYRHAGTDTDNLASITVDNGSPSPATFTEVSATSTQVTISFLTPSSSDVTSALVLRATTTISTSPTEDTAYATSSTIGTATAVCSYTVTASTTYTCTSTGLTNGTPYYFKIFTKDTSGNWSEGTAIDQYPVYTGSIITTLGNGSSTPAVTLYPSSSATTSNTFTLITSSSTDAISSVTVTLATSTYPLISLIEITNNAGGTVYGSVSNPSTDTPSITLTGLTASTTLTQYRIRITPKTHATMPSVPGTTTSFTPYISNWIGTTGVHAGSNATTSAIITVDNTSPSNPTSLSKRISSTESIIISYTNPSDTDATTTLVLRSNTNSFDTPVEGTTYSVGNTLTTSVVACIKNSITPSAVDSCTYTNPARSTRYYFKIFTQDKAGNYSSGAVVSSIATVIKSPAGGGFIEAFNGGAGATAGSGDRSGGASNTGTTTNATTTVATTTPTRKGGGGGDIGINYQGSSLAIEESLYSSFFNFVKSAFTGNAPTVQAETTQTKQQLSCLIEVWGVCLVK